MFMTMFTPVIFGPIKLLHLQRRSKKTVALEAAKKIPKGPTDFPRFFARKVSLLLEVAIPLGAVLRDDCAGGSWRPWDTMGPVSWSIKHCEDSAPTFSACAFLAACPQHTIHVKNLQQVSEGKVVMFHLPEHVCFFVLIVIIIMYSCRCFSHIAR